VYSNGERLGAVTNGNHTWYIADALGSVRQTLDDTGSPLATASYDPWGTPQGNLISPFGFTGELQDAAGLTYLRARWHTPGTGIFLAVDPFEGFPNQPYTQHPYAYALSNPV
jgi:RHS repeat-associated protein